MKHPPAYPLLDKALVDFLDRVFPERCPDPADTEREIWMKAGERRLVRKIRNEYERQERNVPV